MKWKVLCSKLNKTAKKNLSSLERESGIGITMLSRFENQKTIVLSALVIKNINHLKKIKSRLLKFANDLF